MKKKQFYTALIILVSFCFTPSFLQAQVTFNTKVTSGRVLNISQGIIYLNDGFTYYPAMENIKMSVHQGQKVSIQYFINNQQRQYIRCFAVDSSHLQMMGNPIITKSHKVKY